MSGAEGNEKGQKERRRRVEGRKSEMERETKIERRGRDLDRLKHRDRKTERLTDNGMGLTRVRKGSRGPEVPRKCYLGQREGVSPVAGRGGGKATHAGEMCPLPNIKFVQISAWH